MKALRFWKNHPSGLLAGFVLVAAALLVVSLFVGCRASYSHESTAAIPGRSGLHALGAALVAHLVHQKTPADFMRFSSSAE